MNYGIYTLSEIQEKYDRVIFEDDCNPTSDQQVVLDDDFNNELAFVRNLNEREVKQQNNLIKLLNHLSTITKD